MEYLHQIMNSKYFEHIKDHNYFDKKIQRLIEASRIIQKKPLDVICEYGSKSNFLYFVLDGKLAVFIPKNESDLNKQYSILTGIEKCKKSINKDPSQVEVQEKLKKLQTEWQKVQKSFDSDLLNSLKKYQISLAQPHQVGEDEFYLEQRKSISYQTSSFMKRDVCSMKKVGQMTGGDCFGEIGAILDKPRTATIIAIENSTFMLISFEKYKEIFSPEQIYELNFRVLNLSQIFTEKSVETEVVAHLATHFQQIPATTTVYREGDKVDGIYLIHNGHVEIFRTQKDYFNNQISIIIKGKGSLIGLEDYFEFDKNSLILNKDKVKINNKKNGRTYSAVCKDLNMKIYKIDKNILDYFVEGYSHFKNYLLTMAHQKFIEYSSKYQNNLELKKKLSNLTLNLTPSNQQIKKSSIDISEGQIIKQNSLSPIQTNRQKQTSLDRLDEIQNDRFENKHQSSIKHQIEEQYNQDCAFKQKQSIHFPQMLRYENSKIKDLQQNYEMYLKRNRRPQKIQTLNYAKYEAFLKKKFDQDFIDHLENQKKVYQNNKQQRLQRKNNDETHEDIEIDPELHNIDFIAQQNQLKSLKYIQKKQQKSKTEKTEKTAPNITEYSRDNIYYQDGDDIDETDMNSQKQDTEQTTQTRKTNFSQSQYKKLYQFKSMNIITYNKDNQFHQENHSQHIPYHDSNNPFQLYLEQQNKLSNDQNTQTKIDIEYLQQNSIQNIDVMRRLTTQISNQESIPFISNQEFLDQVKNKSSNLFLETEPIINDGQKATSINQLHSEDKKQIGQEYQSNGNTHEELYKKDAKAEKIPNFILEQDRSGKKVILRINRYQSEQLFSPQQGRSQNVSLHHMSNIENNQSHNENNNENNVSILTNQITDRLLNKQGDILNDQSEYTPIPKMKQMSPKIRNKKDQFIGTKIVDPTKSNLRYSLRDNKNEFSPINVNQGMSLGQNSFESENTPQANSTPQSTNIQQNNSLFLPKIQNNSTFILEENKQKKISSFNTNITSPTRSQQSGIQSLKNFETLPIKSSFSVIPQKPFKIEEYSSTPGSKKSLDIKNSNKLNYRQSAPNLKEEDIFNKILNPLRQNKQDVKNLLVSSTKNQQSSEQQNQDNHNQIKFYFSQSTSKRDSIQASKQNHSFLKPSNRHSASMIGLDNENNNSLQFQNQSMISHNFYNSYIISNPEELQIGMGSPDKKLKLRKIINSNNSAFNIHNNNQNYSKPTEHLKMLHKKEQIMDDIQNKISLFPQRKKASFHKETILKKLGSQELKIDALQEGDSPKSPLNKKLDQQQLQNSEISSRFAALSYVQGIIHQNNHNSSNNMQRNSLQEEKILSQTPQKSIQNKNRASLVFKSPQNIKSSSIYKLSQAALTSPKKQLNPTQIILLQKQSKSPNNYISNLFNNKLTSQIM